MIHRHRVTAYCSISARSSQTTRRAHKHFGTKNGNLTLCTCEALVVRRTPFPFVAEEGRGFNRLQFESTGSAWGANLAS